MWLAGWIHTQGGKMSEQEVLLILKDLVKHFPIRQGIIFKRETGAVHAVDGVSFDIYKGETLGLVGESGCGKSTTGRAIMRLFKPTSGQIVFDGVNLVDLPTEEMRKTRKNLQMIFQDPYACLNPRMTVGNMIGEAMVIHRVGSRNEIRDRVTDLLQKVGLDPAFSNRYPHEFSGGQRQRIGIARALALEPKLIVCDEPISALDVSIQAQVVNLLEDLQEDFGLTYLFIAHDLSMVHHIADRVAVMYLGVIVEIADCTELWDHPLHPYTLALMSAVPIPNPRLEEKRKRIILEGDVPSPINPPSGCRFRTRCNLVQDVCAEEKPEMREMTPGHFVACHMV
jgi:oligopeptide transport system ATP-binding protein